MICFTVIFIYIHRCKCEVKIH